MNNKKNGTDFENKLCEILASKGFWCHLMASKKSGQPSDIIAAKDGYAYLIDAKDCKKDKFNFSRMEENQKTAMRRWMYCGNNVGWFALNTSDCIYMISFYAINKFKESGKTSLNLEDMRSSLYTLDEWVDKLGEWNHENND